MNRNVTMERGKAWLRRKVSRFLSFSGLQWLVRLCGDGWLMICWGGGTSSRFMSLKSGVSCWLIFIELS